MARQLAPTGARILILERGERPPEVPQRSDPEAVFVERRYRTIESWQDATGRRYRPGQHYQLGGHTKLYGAAMFVGSIGRVSSWPGNSHFLGRANRQ